MTINNDQKDVDIVINIKKSVLPTIIGGIVGDALGVPVEFEKRDSYKVVDMIGYGTYFQAPGTWSDDTSLTLCLMSNMITKDDMTELMEKFEDYTTYGYMTPNGEMFDIGIATATAIARFQNGVDPELCGGREEKDNGNGSLMRIAPLVFVFHAIQNFETRLIMVEKVSSLTHRHSRAILGCFIYLQFLYLLMMKKAPQDAYDETIQICTNNFKDTVYEEELVSYDRILSKKLLQLDRKDVHSTGYIVDTLEASLWCFFSHDNYTDTVLEAVNLGGDTDTVGFITGTIAGMYYGIEDIPEKWINQLARKEELYEICDKFTGVVVE